MLYIDSSYSNSKACAARSRPGRGGGRIMAMPRAMVTEGSTDEPLLAKEEALPYRFPKWWLFVQASFMLAPAVSNNLILPLLIPPRVAQLVGQERKATALGAVTALDRGISLTGPLLGALSDKISTPCGRRRPFILIGQGFILLGIWGLWLSKTYLVLLLAFQLYYTGCLFSWMPWVTILPELVCEEQRGEASAMNTFTISFLAIIGSIMGILVGESWLPLRWCYLICFVLHAVMVPVGWVAMGTRPGLCSKEKPPPAARAASQAIAQRKLSCCNALCEFFSPFFESSAYCWIFVQGGVYATGSIFSYSWMFYWMDDTINCSHDCEGFVLFGHRVAHSTQTAMAGLGLLSNFISSQAAIPGAQLGDKYGRKLVSITFYVGQALVPLLYALVTMMAELPVSKFLCVLVIQIAQSAISTQLAHESQCRSASVLLVTRAQCSTMYVFEYVCMYVCTYVCMYVCMYVCGLSSAIMFHVSPIHLHICMRR